MKEVNVLISNGVNVDKSLEIFGDMETYNDTLETFYGEIDNKLEEICKYKEIADMANYSILVHSLKSDAKYFGFEKLAELAYQHELESKANNIYYIYDKYEELISESNRIVSVVRQYFGDEPIKELTEIHIPISKDKAILVVDDSDVISGFINKIFNNEYEILIANDGAKALDMIEYPNIVGMLLDLNMPNVNGFAVLEYFRANNLFGKIPVAIITGVENEQAIEKTFNYPIKAVLKKPFNERDVKAAVNDMLASK